MQIINAFISYSWDDEDHKQWVLRFATHLRKHGVNVVLDQWDLRLGDDLSFFMERGLGDTHLVICICSELYVQKADSGIGGVGYEKRILAADMINKTDKRYIIPIIRNNHSTKKLPTFLYDLLYEDFDDDQYFKHYQSVLERIYGEDVKKKPPLGENPFKSIAVSDAITSKLNIEINDFSNIQYEGCISFDYKKNSGRYTIGSGTYEFVTEWSECSSDSIYCYRDSAYRIGYCGDCTAFPSLEEVPDRFDFSSRCWRVPVGQIVILENFNHHFIAIKVLSIYRDDKSIGHKVEIEYKIYGPNVDDYSGE